MKRRVVAFLMISIMAMGLVACGGKKEVPKEIPVASEAPETEVPQKIVRIGMVTDVGGIDDASFNQSVWDGLERAKKDLGVEVEYIESETNKDYFPNIEKFVKDEYDLIICAGYLLSDATRTAAEAYPDQRFAIIDDASCADLPNVTCLMFAQGQAAYLVGVVAAMSTETNNIGFMLGMSSETMSQFGYGYFAGVKDTNPDCVIQQVNVNSFEDAKEGEVLAKEMIENGADVIFHAAGNTGVGMIKACQENRIWAIGVDNDQSALAPETILTSAMKRVDNACYDIAKACKEGALESGVKTYDLISSGVGIAPTTDNLTDKIKAAVEDAKAKIISGDIMVPTNQADFEAKYGDIYELD